MTTNTSALRARREALGLTQIALAAEAEVSLSMLANLERGLRPRFSPARDRIVAALTRLEAEEPARPIAA